MPRSTKQSHLLSRRSSLETVLCPTTHCWQDNTEVKSTAQRGKENNNKRSHPKKQTVFPWEDLVEVMMDDSTPYHGSQQPQRPLKVKFKIQSHISCISNAQHARCSQWLLYYWAVQIQNISWLQNLLVDRANLESFWRNKIMDEQPLVLSTGGSKVTIDTNHRETIDDTEKRRGWWRQLVRGISPSMKPSSQNKVWCSHSKKKQLQCHAESTFPRNAATGKKDQ